VRWKEGGELCLEAASSIIPRAEACSGEARKSVTLRTAGSPPHHIITCRKTDWPEENTEEVIEERRPESNEELVRRNIRDCVDRGASTAGLERLRRKIGGKVRPRSTSVFLLGG